MNFGLERDAETPGPSFAGPEWPANARQTNKTAVRLTFYSSTETGMPSFESTMFSSG